jgi:ElaB/YqjD/DUF883 family membrane-anchored ribosome-binding protein
MPSDTKGNLQTLQQDVDALSEEVSKQSIAPYGDQSLDEVRRRIRRVRADFGKVASDIRERNSRAAVVQMADKVVDPVEDSLSERPIATIALGFALGFTLGLAWRR